MIRQIEVFVTQEEYDMLKVSRSIISEMHENGIDSIHISEDGFIASAYVFNIMNNEYLPEEYKSNIGDWLKGSTDIVLRVSDTK